MDGEQRGSSKVCGVKCGSTHSGTFVLGDWGDTQDRLE